MCVFYLVFLLFFFVLFICSHSEFELSRCITLVCGLAEPLHGFLEVFGDALPVLVANSEVELINWIFVLQTAHKK
jgi:hypothetical protein